MFCQFALLNSLWANSHATATTNQPNLLELIDLVVELGEGTLDTQSLSRLQGMNVFGRVAIIVLFDQEHKLSLFIGC